MNCWVAVVCQAHEVQVVLVSGRNRFEALKAVAALMGAGCQVLKLKRSISLDG